MDPVTTEPTTSTTWKAESRFNRENLEHWLAETEIGGLQDLSIDFGETAWFDIAALTFLLTILSNFRSKGVHITMRLPQLPGNQKARDFLCRWRFKEALTLALDDDLANILSLEQLEYFEKPVETYLPRNLIDDYGDLTVLSSLRLLEITSITDLNAEGNYRVSFSKIGNVTNKASTNVLQSALQSSLRASHEWSVQFGNVLIHQALLNAFEHPDATVAFIAMARQGNNLIISVTDNGSTIPFTISDSYTLHQKHRPPSSEKLTVYQEDANRIAFATKRGTSRKSEVESTSEDRGMGLYYIKTLATEVCGRVLIRASGASVTFRKDQETGKIISEPEPVARLEKGNLIKIYLPLHKAQVG